MLSTFAKNDLGLQFDLSVYVVFGILLIVLVYLMPVDIIGGAADLIHVCAPACAARRPGSKRQRSSRAPRRKQTVHCDHPSTE